MTIIETPRLLLRTWKESDHGPFLVINQDEEVMRYFPGVMTEEEVVSLINRIYAHFKKWGYGLYAAEQKLDGRFIGFIGLSHPRFERDFTPCVEIGWRLSREVWGTGLATEGAKAVVNHALKELELKELYSFTAVDNKASERVMQKIGMIKSGQFDHPNLPANHVLSRHSIYHLRLIE